MPEISFESTAWPNQRKRLPVWCTLACWALAFIFAAVFARDQIIGFERLTDLSTLSADDGMRLQEVRDLASGQDWYDLNQHRYGPPEGTSMHWSRLVDAPIAGTMLLLEPMLGDRLAERVAITLWPSLLFLTYVAILCITLARLFGPGASALGAIVALNLLAFRGLFGAGAIDHHNVQIVLLLSAVAFLAFAGARPLLAAAGGVVSALSLAVGLETLPFIAGVGGLYAGAWIVDARESRAFALFGGSLAVTSLGAFAAQTEPWRWLVPACDALSPPWLLISVGCGAGAVSLALAGRLLTSQHRRLIAALGLAALIVGAFVVGFPGCLSGPYGKVPEELRSAWLELTGEALGLGQYAMEYPLRAAIAFGPTATAAIAAWIGVRHSTGAGRRLLAAAAALLTLTLLLSLLQIRALYVGVALTPLAAGWALDRIVAALIAPSARPASALFGLVAGCFFFELPWALVGDGAARSGLTSPAAPHAGMHACLEETRKLRTLPRATVLAPIDLGAHILFLTDHSIVAAGYHRNVEGIVAGLTAFSGDERTLRDVVRRDHADIVALCRPWIAAYPARYGVFAISLAEGTAQPDWLLPVDLGTSALKVWRVRAD